PELQEFIYNSRDTSYSIKEAGMEFLMGNKVLDLKEIKTRGKSALRFQRKSFAVVLNETLAIEGRSGFDMAYLKRFKLISMAMDKTYIENRIGYGILEEQGIMPLFYRFVELKINGSTQGIYLLVEDPEQYYLDIGSEFILRRGYYNSFDDIEYSPSYHYIPRESYEARFQEIYSSLTTLQGEALYNALNERLNMEQYFRKMGIDYLLQNGDYTDEVYLYALVHQDEPRFSIIPWDYDDLFRSYPHEVGLTWGTGYLLGDRHYETHQDILDEIGDKMIFSIEDDLDYSIAMDPYLYDQYESTIAGMIEEMDLGDIDALFEQVKGELLPFYYNEEIVVQSQFDQHETSFKIWNNNMEDKKAFVKDRLAAMKEQLKEVEP
ncbi:MAG: CotH kinase family protein, partial [Bacteroidales bacterium]|nr:CotH kinase family protein [Bacteroidales bacterium]